MELFLDRSSPLGWAVAAVLFLSGLAAVWIGVRDGFVRRRLGASSGLMTGRRAVLAGAVYVLSGIAGVWAAVAFAIR